MPVPSKTPWLPARPLSPQVPAALPPFSLLTQAMLDGQRRPQDGAQLLGVSCQHQLPPVGVGLLVHGSKEPWAGGELSVG